MSVAADASDTLECEIERLGGEACTSEEWNKERTKTAVDMQRETTLLTKGYAGQCGDIVNDAMRKIRSRTDEKDRVTVNQAGDTRDMDSV